MAYSGLAILGGGYLLFKSLKNKGEEEQNKLSFQPHVGFQNVIPLHLPDLGPISLQATIDVDAQTREVMPLSSEQISTLQAQAHAIAARLTPETAPAI